MSWAKRQGYSLKSGFTVVELLTVIVVIAILAVVIVSLYDNVGVQANDTTAKSDLSNAVAQLELDKKRTGKYPDTQSQANNGKGLIASPDVTITYAPKPYGYCVSASHPDASGTFVIRSLDGKLAEGNCNPLVTVIAGPANGFTSGFNDATGEDARFNSILGLERDTAGNLYVGDNNNDRVRKITPEGVVTTLAGSGADGSADGSATTATFRSPQSLISDRSGMLYLADSDDRHVRVITPDGTVSTLMNTGTGVEAWFNRISGIDRDPSGNLYVLEWYRGRIYKVSPSGIVTSLAGTGAVGWNDGAGATAAFYDPVGMVLGPDNALYVADSGNRRIRKVLPDGTVSTLAGSGTSGSVDGSAATAQFLAMRDIAMGPDGLLYVSEHDADGKLRVVAKNGDVSTILIPGVRLTRNLVFDVQGVLYIAGAYHVAKVLL